MLYFFCFRSTDNASVPTVLNYTWPAFTVIFSEYIFNYKKSSWQTRFLQCVGILLGIFGVAVVSSKGDLSQFLKADVRTTFLGMAAGMSYGLFSGYS